MRLANIVMAAALAFALGGCNFSFSLGNVSDVGANSADADTGGAAVGHRRVIQRVLEEDARAGQLQTPQQVAEAMRRISLAGAPSDFRRAYLLHVQSWERWAAMETSAGSVLDAAPETVRQIEQQREQLEGEIERTFERVEEIATRYGARLQPRPTQNGNSS